MIFIIYFQNNSDTAADREITAQLFRYIQKLYHIIRSSAIDTTNFYGCTIEPNPKVAADTARLYHILYHIVWINTRDKSDFQRPHIFIKAKMGAGSACLYHIVWI